MTQLWQSTQSPLARGASKAVCIGLMPGPGSMLKAASTANLSEAGDDGPGPCGTLLAIACSTPQRQAALFESDDDVARVVGSGCTAPRLDRRVDTHLVDHGAVVGGHHA